MENLELLLKEYCKNNYIQPVLKLKDIRSSKRTNEYVSARIYLVKYIRDNFKWSYPRIGRFINRDHCSVMNLYKK